MTTHDGIDERPLILPGLAGLYGTLAPYSYAFMRFCTGAILVPHGVQKLFFGGVYGLAANNITKLGLTPPLAWAYWIGIIECFGGAMLALGLLTRPVAAIIFIEMIVAILGFHLPNGYFWTKLGFEYPLLLGLLALGIFFRGGERLSIDRAIGREF